MNKTFSRVIDGVLLEFYEMDPEGFHITATYTGTRDDKEKIGFDYAQSELCEIFKMFLEAHNKERTKCK